MSNPIPRIQKYMSTSPHTIGAEQTLKQAQTMMQEYKVRHLPVLRGGKLEGMLTDRDIKLIASLKDADVERVKVEDAMTTETYAVSPEAPLVEVVGEMAENKYGSVVVMHGGKVVGVFTTVDACTTLRGLLRERVAK